MSVRVPSSQMIAIELPNQTMQQHATRTPKASRVLPPLCAMRCALRQVQWRGCYSLRGCAQVWGAIARNGNGNSTFFFLFTEDRQTRGGVHTVLARAQYNQRRARASSYQTHHDDNGLRLRTKGYSTLIKPLTEGRR